MSSSLDLIRARARRRAHIQKTAKTRLIRFGWGLATVIAITLALGLIILTVAYTSFTRDLPSLQTIPTLLTPPNGMLLQPTRFYDRTGQTVLATLRPHALQNHNTNPAQYLRLDQLPASLLSATLAAQLSNTNYQLPIFDPSPLSQSLISNLLLFSEPPSSRRDFRLALLAFQLERTYGDDQILEWHLNSASFGRLVYGVDAAAWTYFGKSAKDLTLPESALLAAVSQAPDLNPFDTPELALERRQAVLQTMLAQGVIGESDAQTTLDSPLGALDLPPEQTDRDTAFLDFVLKELAPHIPRTRLEQGGLKIITTLDANLQSQISCAIDTQLSRVTNREFAPPFDCETARLLPTVTLDSNLPLTGLSAQAVILDPSTGQILALSGLSDSGEYPSQLTPHAPGTLLTPYVYLTAFTRGFSPASLVWDIPANLPPGFLQNPNLDGQYHGPQRMRLALANDYLVPTLDLLRELGPENVWKTAAQLGLPSLSIPSRESTSTSDAALNLPLEGGNLTLLEVAQGYGVFSSQGILFGYAQTDETGAPLLPTALLRVEDVNGQVWYETGSPDARPVISAQLAYLLTHILSDETARWPGLGHPNALEIGRPVGVKLGYTREGSDTWAIGFTPQLVTAVWAGVEPNHDKLDTGDQTPALPSTPAKSNTIPKEIAAALWHGLTKYAARDLPPETWSTPPGISTIDVCDPSGQLPTAECPLIVKEIFTPGNEPTHTDTLYRRIQINRETGLLATVFTSPALIEERIYLVPPPEAAEWARQAGLPTPPETYDLVSVPTISNPDARLEFPDMFASVSGQVNITGSASGADFQSYQVQIGQGLNPQQWIGLSAPGDAQPANPVDNGTLAVWDTTGLNGLYAIRLLVIRTDQRVDTAILQVTVDNTPPTAAIVYPAENQSFTYPQDDSVTFQFNAVDDLALAEVELFLDNQPVATFTQPPYAHHWDVIPGEHSLRVRATDLAGNIGEVTVHFSVKR